MMKPRRRASNGQFIKTNDGQITEKYCNKCKQTHAISAFYNQRGGKFSCWCKSCHQSYVKMYDNLNRDKKRAHNKYYYQANAPDLRQYTKDYQRQNKEKVNAQVRARRKKAREQFLARADFPRMPEILDKSDEM